MDGVIGSQVTGVESGWLAQVRKALHQIVGRGSLTSQPRLPGEAVTWHAAWQPQDHAMSDTGHPAARTNQSISRERAYFGFGVEFYQAGSLPAGSIGQPHRGTSYTTGGGERPGMRTNTQVHVSVIPNTSKALVISTLASCPAPLQGEQRLEHARMYDKQLYAHVVKHGTEAILQRTAVHPGAREVKQICWLGLWRMPLPCWPLLPCLGLAAGCSAPGGESAVDLPLAACSVVGGNGQRVL